MEEILNFWVLFAASRVGILILQIALNKAIPDRKQGRHLAQPEFQKTDWAYMLINQFNETFFIKTLMSYEAIMPSMKVSFAGVAHVFLSSYLLLKTDDFMYWLFHRGLHKHRKLYSKIHLHHHKNEAPCRGYFDAINEHPLEMSFALVINMVAINILFPALVSQSILLFLFSKACFAIINHMDRNFKIPFMYDSERHILHHSKKVVHFGQM